MEDAYDLARFVAAQDPVYARVLGELRAGVKTGHWMWFVFPQLAALGRSETALFYGIGSADEARAYLAHPLLGPRLAECTGAVLGHPDRSAKAIFGEVDALKLASSMTLFDAVGGGSEFRQCLDTFFGGGKDERTLGLLAAERQ